jgi:photosystem II stability/assembly factor-like uncharacterized protein
MLACLSPNGLATYALEEPATTLLVGTVKGVVGLHRSADNRAWHSGPFSLGEMQINALLTEPRSGLVFAGTAGHGLYASADRGSTWTRRSAGLRDDHVFAMALDARFDRPVLYAGMLPPALYRSRDLGQTWEELASLKTVPDADKWNFRAPPGAAHVKNIAFHPTEHEALYVCVEQGGLLRSTDDGATWQEIDTWIEPEDFFYRDAHRLVISQRRPEVMFLATGDGLCKTTDAGLNWSRLTTGQSRIGYPDAVFVDPATDDVVYVAGAGGHPGTWDEHTSRPGVIRSADGGLTWATCMQGLPELVRGNIEAVSLVSSPLGTTFFFGTAVGEVWCSDDGAQNWRLIAELPPISKAGHYRRFLAPAERALAEQELMRQSAMLASRS